MPEPSIGIEVRCAVRTELGDRAENEDVARVLRPAVGETLCLLADGLGGHGAGRLAATMAVETIVRHVDGGKVDRESLTDVVAKANAAIVAAQRASPSFATMRTTLVLLHLDAHSAFWLHCGDSRLYFVRDGGVMSRTLDHSVAQMHASDPDTASAEADRHRLLRSLGGASTEARPRTVGEAVRFEHGDRFLLCSDGWWEALDAERLVAPGYEDPAAWLDDLRDESGRAAGGDNASAIALFVTDGRGRPHERGDLATDEGIGVGGAHVGT